MSQKLGKKALKRQGAIPDTTPPKEMAIAVPSPKGVMINLDQAAQSGQVPHNSLLSMYHGRGNERDYSNVFVRLLVAAYLIKHVLHLDEAGNEIAEAVQAGSRAMQEILDTNKTRPEGTPPVWRATPDQYHVIEIALDVMDQLQRQVTRKELQDVADKVLASLNRTAAERKKMPADAMVSEVFEGGN